MVDTICIIEGVYYSQLLPLVYFRPTYDLLSGCLKLREKIELSYPDIPITLHARPYLVDSVKEKNPGVHVNEFAENVKSCLFINGRVICDKAFKDQVSLEGVDAVYVDGETIIAAKLSGTNLDRIKLSMNHVFKVSDFDGIIRKQVNVKHVNYQWDLIAENAVQIKEDFERLVDRSKNMIKGTIHEGVFMINKENIFIDEGASVKPAVVLDAELGPIYIGKDAKIMPHVYIQGPCYIGDKSIVKASAKIYEGTSIGKVCKVGGEIEESIIHSYSNKQHDGFLGHAYLGSWVNIGADTNNSDLKNNYGSVKVIINDKQIDSGSMFVGLTMGDHSKSAINTMFNTGTVVGVSSNIFGAGFVQKYVPSFAWGGGDITTTYELKKALEVAERVMARRKVLLTEIEVKLFENVFNLTRDERRKRGMPN